MNNIYDYIFCPFCGGNKWISDRTGGHPTGNGRLESHKCAGCKKFTYVNSIKKEKSPAGLEIFSKSRFSVVAKIEPYIISVFYEKPATQFQDINTNNVILVLNSAVTFNWYKNEELVDKIKKYVVFS